MIYIYILPLVITVASDWCRGDHCPGTLITMICRGHKVEHDLHIYNVAVIRPHIEHVLWFNNFHLDQSDNILSQCYFILRIWCLIKNFSIEYTISIYIIVRLIKMENVSYLLAMIHQCFDVGKLSLRLLRIAATFVHK